MTLVVSYGIWPSAQFSSISTSGLQKHTDFLVFTIPLEHKQSDFHYMFLKSKIFQIISDHLWCLY